MVVGLSPKPLCEVSWNPPPPDLGSFRSFLLSSDRPSDVTRGVSSDLARGKVLSSPAARRGALT